MEVDVQKVRMKNLRALHGRPDGYGSPSSKYFVKFLNHRGAGITEPHLSELYRNAREMSDYLAMQIEAALELPAGWLSTDHEIFYKLDAKDMHFLQQLLMMPQDVRRNLYALVESMPASNRE